MVMPPFAPPPYVDSSAYILPHPHIQPVDYRRFLHPQAPASTAPYQNPNPLRRIRLPQAAPGRATVNSAVQTEPAQRNAGHYTNGSPPVHLDSGHGTTSDSPSSSSSSSQKQASDRCSLTATHAQDLQAHKIGKNVADQPGGDVLPPHPAAVDVPSCMGKTVERQECRKAGADQEAVPSYKNSHCNMWSVGSPDGILPVCTSSQQEDEVVKERRVSFPDILMSWGGGTPKETVQKIPNKVFDQQENQLASRETAEEREKSVCRSPLAASCSVVLENSDVDDSGSVLLSQKCPMEPRQNESLEMGNSGRCSRMEGKVNESIWSVESLPPYIPSKELIFQKNTLDSETVIEMSEETEMNKQAIKPDNLANKCGKKKLEFDSASLSDSGPMSNSWLDFSSPSQRDAYLSNKEAEGPELEPGHNLSPAETNLLTSITPPQCDVVPTAEEAKPNRSSEPEDNESPNQDMTIKNTEQEQRKGASPVSAVGEEVLQNGADPETLTCDRQQRTIDAVSPSNGHMVDCAIQCTSLLYPQEPRRFNFKHSGEATML